MSGRRALTVPRGRSAACRREEEEEGKRRRGRGRRRRRGRRDRGKKVGEMQNKNKCSSD